MHIQQELETLISLQIKQNYEKAKIIKIKVGNIVYIMSEDDFIKLKKFRQNENS